MLEADRCLECGGPYAEAPCVVACPAGVDVPAFIAAIARGDHDARRGRSSRENLLGGTCARVCPVEMLCEGACVLAHEGRRPIEIGRLQRFAAERALAARRAAARAAAVQLVPRRRDRRRPGGARLRRRAAARGYDVTVYDERDEPGGLVRYAIAPYRQLREPLPKEARRSPSSASSSSSDRDRHARSAARTSRTTPTRSCSPSAWAPTPMSPIPATSCRRLELAAVHRGDQDRPPPDVGRARRRDRRRQHGDRRRS